MAGTVSEHIPSPPAGVAPGTAVLVLDRDCVVLGLNPAARRLLGPDMATGVVLPIEILFQGPYAGAARTHLEEALGKGLGVEQVRARLHRPEGLPAECVYGLSPLNGRFGEISGVIFTIKELDLSLVDEDPSEAKDRPPHMPRLGYRALFENLAEGVFTINLHWRITSFNQRASELTGYRKEEVLGRFCWDIFRSDLCETGCPLRTTLDTGVMRMDQDVRMISKEGRTITVLTNTSVIKDGAGQVVGAVESFRQLSQGEPALPPSEAAARPFPEIVGTSPPLKRLLELLPEVARSQANVLITGESGTGKELFARAIHSASPRRDAPFAAVNCSALAETLLESELFGHEKAAFTGAVRSKVGRFELARGGTLFLDEIGDLKPELQVKLLRVLEQRVFERVGGSRLIPLDARIIAATNRDLAQALREGRFREDLYYRLRTVPIDLPPLRRRPQDIAPLIDHFIRRQNQLTDKQVRALDPKAMRLITAHHWPGNVRELERVIEYAFVFVKGPVIFARHLPPLGDRDQGPAGAGDEILPAPAPQAAAPAPASTAAPTVDDGGAMRRAVLEALSQTGGKKAAAAQVLGISRTSLWRRMKELGIG